MQQILALIKYVQIQEAINKSLHAHENLAKVHRKNNLASKGLLSFNAADCSGGGLLGCHHVLW